MKLTIDQITLCPPDMETARWLLNEMGATDWLAATEQRAYNYQLGKEVELLQGVSPHTNYLGMYCSSAALEEWRTFFRAREIPLIQELEFTHNKQRQRSCLFGTRSILGVDLKFTVVG